MPKISKRMQKVRELVGDDLDKIYTADSAIALLKQCTDMVGFEESIDIAVNLGIDPRKVSVRGAIALPHGLGKTVRAAVFAQNIDVQEQAKAAGAEVVGFEDLAASIKAGEINFDVLIASPEAMRLIGPLGQILGPKGLMPNPKLGTVTPDVVSAVKRVKAGQASLRADKGGVVHCSIGRANFELNSLLENLKVVLAEIMRLKPVEAKGVYIKKVFISTTMGPGLCLDHHAFI